MQVLFEIKDSFRLSQSPFHQFGILNLIHNTLQNHIKRHINFNCAAIRLYAKTILSVHNKKPKHGTLTWHCSSKNRFGRHNDRECYFQKNSGNSSYIRKCDNY